MSQLVNFCYRNIRVNKVHMLRSRMQPFWLLRNGTLRPTGYAKGATAFVETAKDAQQLRNDYKVILLQPGVNCEHVGEDYHFTMPEGTIVCM